MQSSSPAPGHSIFQSFFLGGFECATHRAGDSRRIDAIAASQHDKNANSDYELLTQVGVRTVRDGLRWHCIETTPGLYDWSSFLPMLHAATDTGTQVIWDLCHWGTPVDLDLFSEEFPRRFASFASAAAILVRNHRLLSGNGAPAFYCAINEISFWSWIGGEVGAFDPYMQGRGGEMKQQLVRASIAAIGAIRAVDPTARFVQPEPLINISPGKDGDPISSTSHTFAQYEAWDMLAGNSAAELGGSSDTLDLIGVNYYWDNQWLHDGQRTPPGHLFHRPLHQMLYDVWVRYNRPLLVTETGAEVGGDLGWLGYVTAEVRQAQRMGVPVLGICLYPVMDYCGWDDDRHCFCGLIEATPDWSVRHLRKDIVEELSIQQQLFGS